MHEYSIVAALLERVEAEARRHGATRVERVQVRIGALSGVEPRLLATAFDTFRERTVCRDARLDVVPVETRWDCPRCGSDIPAGGPLTCEACGAPARLASGDEILLERIELEVP